ncbi:MAG TPA: DUF1189 domain-containing protein [bacterium]|nr:DUF1189 domain-containing protein [bacterium]
MSAVNPFFFRTVVRKSAVRAFVYYMVFTTLYTLAVCGVGVWWLSRNWTPALQVAKNSLPPFEIKIDQGHLSTTLPEPFVFSDAEFTLIVDTSGKVLSAEDLENYEQALVITKTKAIIKKSRFESREYLWSAAPDFQLTSTDVIDWLIAYKDRILWILFAAVALGVLPLLWLFLIPVICFLALLLLIPARLFGTGLQYGQTASIAFYAITLPTLLQTVLVTQGLAKSGIFWLVYLGWSVLGVAVTRGTRPPSTGEASAPPPPPPSFPPLPQRS